MMGGGLCVCFMAARLFFVHAVGVYHAIKKLTCEEIILDKQASECLPVFRPHRQCDLYSVAFV